MNIGRRQQQDRENIEVTPSWAHEVDFVRQFVDVSLAPLLSYCYLRGEKKNRPFGKRRTSHREETNVPSRRDKCSFGKRRWLSGRCRRPRPTAKSSCGARNCEPSTTVSPSPDHVHCGAEIARFILLGRGIAVLLRQLRLKSSQDEYSKSQLRGQAFPPLRLERPASVALLALVQKPLSSSPLVEEGRNRRGLLRGLSRVLLFRRADQSVLALRQVALAEQHHAPQECGCLGDLQRRWQTAGQVFQRKPLARALRLHRTGLCRRPHFDRRRTLLQPPRCGLLRYLRCHEGCSSRTCPRSFDHHAAVGDEYVSRSHGILHRSARLHPRRENPHHEE